MFALAWMSTLIASLLGRPSLSTQSFLLSLLAPVVAVVGLVVGVGAFFRGFRLLERKRRIENTPTSTVRAAALGLIELYGKVVGPYTLLAPLSQLDCYYYRVVVQGVPESDREGEETREKEETLCVPFFIDDGTGQLMVDPRGAEINLQPDIDEQCALESFPVSWRGVLERHGVVGMSSCWVREWNIKPGDALYVLGTLAEKATQPAWRKMPPGSPRAILSRQAAALQRLEVLDAMKLPVTEPQASFPTAAAEFDVEPRVLLRKATGHPFFISSQTQRDVVATLATNSTLYIWGGPLMALISVGVILHWLGSL
jgi:hypothetical protein